MIISMSSLQIWRYIVVYKMLAQVSVGAWCVPKVNTLVPTMAVLRLQALEVQADPQWGPQ